MQRCSDRRHHEHSDFNIAAMFSSSLLTCMRSVNPVLQTVKTPARSNRHAVFSDRRTHNTVTFINEYLSIKGFNAAQTAFGT